MNKKVRTLTKVFLKNSFQNMSFGQKKESSPTKKMGMLFLYLILILYIAGIFGVISYGMITSLMAIEQEQVFIGIFFLAIAFLMLFQSVISGMNILYFAKDIEYVLPLPLKPREILMAKINTILITEYITEFLFGIVPLSLFGILTGAGITYYFMMLFVLLLFPILPILIALLLIMLVMGFAKIAKNRDKFQTVVTFLMIIVILVFSFWINQTEQISDEETMQMLLQANGMVQMIQGYFITLQPAIGALTAGSVGASLLELIKLFIITAIGYLIFLAVGQKLYFRGAVGSSVGNTKVSKMKTTNKTYIKRKVGVAYVIKELKILFRNPIYFMQCVLPAILMPIVLFGIAGVSALSQTEGAGMQEIASLIQQFSYVPLAAAIVLAVIQFFAMLLYIAPTAFSRDGVNATFIKYIPVPLYKQFMYKGVPSLIFYGVETFITLVVFSFLGKVSIGYLIALFLVSMLLGVIATYLMQMVDLRKPKLEWDTEYAVVKQNMNLVWPMLLGVVIIGILIVLAIVIPNVWIYLAITAIMALVVVIILQSYIKKNQKKLFCKII